MKNKTFIKKLILVAITVALSFSMIISIGKFLDPDYMAPVYSHIKAFHTLPENSVDVISYGSSKMWKGFDTKYFSEHYNLNAYNYGCNWQRINTTKYFLKDSLITQKPKIAIVDTYNLEVLHDVDMNGEIYYSRYMPNSDARKEYLKECFNDNWGRYLSYYFPIIAFHEKWETINKETFDPLTDNKDKYIKSHGFNASKNIEDLSSEADGVDFTDCEQKELPDDVKKELDEITSICKENSITLIYVIIPAIGEYNYLNAMEEYAEDNNCAFLNLYKLEGEYAIDPANDYQDGGHLNKYGAEKIAKYLGDYLMNYNN